MSKAQKLDHWQVIAGSATGYSLLRPGWTCQVCEVLVDPDRRADARFCSEACRQRDGRRRRQAGAVGS
jgi:predicted nucleic acid-binding Zn ribbon protein